MAKIPINTYPDAVLHRKTEKVKNPLDAGIQTLISDMIETLRAENGVGIAAPQVGHSLRVCIIEEGGMQYVLINPTITAKSKTKVIAEEGCLSYPGKFFPIERYEKVQVRYLDKNGKSAKIKSGGLLARALQHEIDHLDGILILDRMKKKS